MSKIKNKQQEEELRLPPDETLTQKQIEQKNTKEWGSAKDALNILKQVNGRDIHPKYLGALADQKRLIRKQFDERTFQYWLPSAWDITIHQDTRRGNRTTHGKQQAK